jgi:putative membrane protein
MLASRGSAARSSRIGILLLVGGIICHVVYMTQFHQERTHLAQQHLIHAQSPYPFSLSLPTALVLLGLGVVALLGVSFGLGPLG